ncbi:MAG: Eco57I restriction-modification methylase domain-containing protein [Anaerolineales bacterium]
MGQTILDKIEISRKEISAKLDSDNKSNYGQFLTPISIAMAMANMFDTPHHRHIRLLDPGAGTGSLTISFLEMLYQRGVTPQSIHVTAYEIDCLLADELRKNSTLIIDKFKSLGIKLDISVIEEDFITSAVYSLKPHINYQHINFKPFSHIIMNPPYLKISSSSEHRALLNQIGVKVNNLYSAFIALSTALLSTSGHLVGISPRSFCNGPYFKSFRRYILRQVSFKHIHTFERRDKVFTEDKVLQENIIFYLQKNATKDFVKISSSNGRSLQDTKNRYVPHSQIVDEKDPDLIIRIPINEFDDYVLNRVSAFSNRLGDFGLNVSTGPIVDFRVKDSLEKDLVNGSVPLIYPSHFNNQIVDWPKTNGKKPNALLVNDSTNKWLFPNGYFPLVKRFSSKEERRRIYPACFDPIENFRLIGFENHLNVIHSSQAGISKELSRGLVAYLSSTIIDLYFRQFSGHTQVNASDIRSIPFPTLDILEEMSNFHDGICVDYELVDVYLETIFTKRFGIKSPNPLLITKIKS